MSASWRALIISLQETFSWNLSLEASRVSVRSRVGEGEKEKSCELSNFPPTDSAKSFNLMKIKMSCTMNKFFFGEIFSPSLIARLYRFLLC